MAAQADPERAAGQQRYMKSAMPYYGLVTPKVREVVKTAVAEFPLPDRQAWLDAISALWDEATHREERYAALGVLRHRRYQALLIPDEVMFTLLRHLITSGAWWDLVDELAHVAGDLLATDRAAMTEVLRGWSREENLWLRRVSIISQLWAKNATDLALLDYAITGSLDDTDFFARKAIGWALREYAKTDPDWVRDYVERRAERLSNLSRREALKHLH